MFPRGGAPGWGGGARRGLGGGCAGQPPPCPAASFPQVPLPASPSGPQHDCASSHDPPLPPPSPAPRLPCRSIQVIHHLLPPLPRSRIFLPIPLAGERGARRRSAPWVASPFVSSVAPPPAHLLGGGRSGSLTLRHGRCLPALPPAPWHSRGRRTVSPGSGWRPRGLLLQHQPCAGRELRARCPGAHGAGEAVSGRRSRGEAGDAASAEQGAVPTGSGLR